jgi:excisionase family DNA binding protein
MDPSFLTPKEVADFLNVKVSRVYTILLNGKLRAVRAGSNWRITPEGLQQYLAEYADSAALRRLGDLMDARAQATPTPTPDSDRGQVLLPREVATILRVNLKTAYKLLESGQIAAVRVGNRWRTTRKAVEDFLNPASRRRGGSLLKALKERE